MINIDSISNYDELDEYSLVLALKLIELRIYIDISYTEKILAKEKNGVKPINPNIKDLDKVFLNKIVWFKEWTDRRNSKLVSMGLDNIESMEINEILELVRANDSVRFKRNKILNEIVSTPIYIDESENKVIEDEYTLQVSSLKVSEMLGLA